MKIAKAKSIAITLGVFAAMFQANAALAGSATLTWNANTEPDLAGYKVYYGTSARTDSCPQGGYQTTLNVGNVTTYTLNNLTDGQTYYFSVTAFDTSNNESCFSNEVSKLIVPSPTYNNASFAVLAADWMQTKTSTADVNGDGTVNGRDLGIMMSNWSN